MLGRYCPPNTYGSFLLSALKNELASYYPHTQTGALKAFGYLLKGTIEILPNNYDLGRVEEILEKLFGIICDDILD